MTSLVLHAEFDIDKGSILSGYYPHEEELKYSAEFLADVMLPEGVHNREKDHTVFFLNREKEEDAFLYCLSLVQTKHDDSVRRGAIVRAVALCSPYHYYFSFKPLLEIALLKLETNPIDRILRELYDTLQQIDFSHVVTMEDTIHRQFLHRTLCAKPIGREKMMTPQPDIHKATLSATWGDRSNIPLPIDTTGNTLLLLVSTFREKTIKIYNALITGRRVLLLGYNHPAGQVCDFVLATNALVSPPLPSVLARQFPYANLTDLGFLSVPGYIAGVTNPMFKTKREWWDVLADISTGQVIVNDHQEYEECENMDKEFIVDVLEGIQAGFPPEWVQKRFEEYTLQNIVEIAFDEPWSPMDAKVYAMNNPRITRWATTRSFEKMKESRKPLGVMQNHIRVLTLGAEDSSSIEQIYVDLVASIESESQLIELLSFLPDSRGGLHLLAQGLLHSSPSVREHTIILLKRLETYDSTRESVENLNIFISTIYNRMMTL